MQHSKKEGSPMASDIEIAQSVTPREIGEIASKLGLDEKYLER